MDTDNLSKISNVHIEKKYHRKINHINLNDYDIGMYGALIVKYNTYMIDIR